MKEKRYLVIDSKGNALELFALYAAPMKKGVADVAVVRGAMFGKEPLAFKKKFLADFIADLLNDEPNGQPFSNQKEADATIKKQGFSTEKVDLPVRVVEIVAEPGERTTVCIEEPKEGK